MFVGVIQVKLISYFFQSPTGEGMPNLNLWQSKEFNTFQEFCSNNPRAMRSASPMFRQGAMLITQFLYIFQTKIQQSCLFSQ